MLKEFTTNTPNLRSQKTSVCKGDVCVFDFIYRNSLLSRLRLASKVVLGVRILVYRNRVDGILTDLDCGVWPHLYGIYIEDGTTGVSPLYGPFHIYNQHGETTWVSMMPSATPEQRNGVYSLGLNCFDRIGRCHSKAELMPKFANEVVPR